MDTVVFSKELDIGGKKVKEIRLDFDKITGSDMAKAEKEVRAMGDQTPSVFLSMQYQAALAAKLLGVPADDVFALPAKEFKKLVLPVASFLFETE